MCDWQNINTRAAIFMLARKHHRARPVLQTLFLPGTGFNTE
jgi:hypothetical protein